MAYTFNNLAALIIQLNSLATNNQTSDLDEVERRTTAVLSEIKSLRRLIEQHQRAGAEL